MVSDAVQRRYGSFRVLVDEEARKVQIQLTVASHEEEIEKKRLVLCRLESLYNVDSCLKSLIYYTFTVISRHNQNVNYK
jgi:hypothetical protein